MVHWPSVGARVTTLEICQPWIRIYKCRLYLENCLVRYLVTVDAVQDFQASVLDSANAI
ncbi:hypothetical protein D3C71_1904460 [compost metagenome]